MADKNKEIPVLSKDYERLKRTLGNNKEKKISIPYEDIVKITNKLKLTSDINKDVMDLFPDINLIIEIIVSSILSPNDLTNMVVNLRFDNIPLSTDLSNAILNILNKYIKEELKYFDNLHEIIEESMFTKGGYIEAYLPVDGIIDIYQKRNKKNKTTNRGIIKNKTIIPGLLSINDDYSTLFLPDIKKQEWELHTTNLVAGYEDNSIGISSMFLDYNGKSSIIIKKIPYESVIPIADDEDPSKHYGYFIVVNNNGKPVNSDYSKPSDLIEKFKENSNKSIAQKIMERAKKTLLARSDNIDKLKNIDTIREVLIEEEISKILSKNPVADITGNAQKAIKKVSEILLNKILNNEEINVIFLPSSMVHYYAYRYKENGIGESILEKATILLSIKAILMFAKLIAYVKSNITTTEVNVTLDEDDPEYQKTMEKIIGYVMESRQLNLPIGVTKIDDIADWTHKVGFAFNFKHPGLPNVEIDIDEKVVELKPIDEDLRDEVNKSIYRLFGLSPEMVDEAFSPDFATTIVRNSVLFAKRIAKYQNIYSKHISEALRKIISTDASIRDILKEELSKNVKKVRSSLKKYMPKAYSGIIDKLKEEELIEQTLLIVINKLRVEFAPPVVTENTNIKELFENYIDEVDKVIDILFTTDTIPEDIVGEFSDKIDVLKNLIRAILIKKWVVEHGYIEGLSDLFKLDRDGEPMLNILEEYDNYVKTLEKTIIPFLKRSDKFKKKMNETLEKIENDEEETEENYNEENNETEETETNEENEESKTTEENEEGNTEEPEAPEMPEEPEL